MRWPRISSAIRAKITLPYLFLAFIVAFGGAYIISNVLIDSIEKRFENSLIEVGKISADMLVKQENSQLELLRLLARVDGVGLAIQNNDVEKLRTLFLPFFINSEDKLLALVLPDGTTQVMMIKPDGESLTEIEFTQGGSQFSGQDFFINIINENIDSEGDKYAGLLQVNNKPYFLVSGPITTEGSVVAVLVVGQELQLIADTIRQETLAQLSFYNQSNQLILTTLSTPPQINPELANVPPQSIMIRDITVTDITYREVFGKWTIRNGVEIGFMGIALPTNFISETNQVTRLNFFGLVFIMLVFIVGMGLVISNIITRPILNLRDAALQVSSGNLNISVPPIGRDEISTLTDTFNTMVGNLKVSEKALLDAYDKTLEGWSKALELRDNETEGHTQRVTATTLLFAKSLGANPTQLEYIRRGALLHDIGKVGVSDRILLKESDLTEAEWVEMHKHPVFAKDMISQIEFLVPSMDIPYSHHEKWDGSGYPQGLKGKDIPLAARVFALVDVWDAITSNRPYRAAMSFDEAINVIKAGRGTFFDPELVDPFIKLITQIHRNSHR